MGPPVDSIVGTYGVAAPYGTLRFPRISRSRGIVGRYGSTVDSALGPQRGSYGSAASEQRGNNWTVFKDCDFKAKARIWP